MSIILLCAHAFIFYVNYNYIYKYNFSSNILQFLLFLILFLYQVLEILYFIKNYITLWKKEYQIKSKLLIIKYDIKLDVCPICLDDYRYIDNISKIIKCNHVYHTKCIRDWFIISKEYICPMCKAT